MWTSFVVPAEKVEGIASKWAEAYGTQLPSWKRQDRKEKKLATEHALTRPKASDWSREKWLTRLLVMIGFRKDPGVVAGVRINWVVRFRSPGFLILGNYGGPGNPRGYWCPPSPPCPRRKQQG